MSPPCESNEEHEHSCGPWHIFSETCPRLNAGIVNVKACALSPLAT